MREGESLPKANLVIRQTAVGALSNPARVGEFSGAARQRGQHFSASPSIAENTPWWLWWNILSIDAPTVAAIWALVFARAGGIKPGILSEAVLVLAVFLIYVGDRLLDGFTAVDTTKLQHRHIFCTRHRVALSAIVMFLAVTIFWIAAARLPAAQIRAGLTLAAVVAAYILGIHAGDGVLARRVPKELVVGILFAAGTSLPVWSQSHELDGAIWLLLISFALLCSLNCVAIDFWEAHPATSGSGLNTNTVPLRSGYPEIYIDGMAAATVLIAVAASWIERVRSIYVAEFSAIALAAFLLLILNRWRRRLSRPALRVLADAALVVAGLFGLLMHF
jgi:hypothetical protein